MNDVVLAHRAYDAAIKDALAQGFTPHEIGVNVTGGTAIVTAGALFACLQHGVDPEYIEQGITPTRIIPIAVDWVDSVLSGRSGARAAPEAGSESVPSPAA